jgi:flagellar biosynthetic protein FliO
MRREFVAIVLSCLALVPAAMPARADDKPVAGDQSGIIDLFGHQSEAPKPAVKTPLESEQEIKRPDAIQVRHTTAFSAEQKALERQTKASVGWRVYDLIPLGIVLGLIVVVALVIKRFMPARSLLGGAGLEILTRLNVSSKQSVAVVKVGKRLLVLGICPERINTLCVIEDPVEMAEYLGEIAARQPSSITQAFKNSFDQEVDVYPEADPEAIAGGQVRGLLEKVRSMKKSREVA